MKSVVIRKIIVLAALMSMGTLLVAVADDDGSTYGIQAASPANTTANSNGSSATANQQAMINALLKQANNPAPQNSASPTAALPNTQNAQGAPVPQASGSTDPVSDEAFANTVRNMMPLTPDQIRLLRYLFDQSQKAAATDPGVPPKPTSTSTFVNLSPGATPPIVRLSSGFVTSLVFIDSTGAPWPIQAYDLGDAQSFNVQWDQKGNTLLIQALRRYTSGNLAVILKGLNTPVMLTLMPGQNAVDYRMDLRVPGLGPNANPVLDGLPSTESPQLLDILNGVPPDGSKTLTVNGAGGDCQAWLVNDGHLYLRTTLTVLSPGWIATMSSADGTHAYELQTTPVVLASDRGKLIKLTIEGL